MSWQRIWNGPPLCRFSYRPPFLRRRQLINELFRYRLIVLAALPFFLSGISCGLKAAPQPRELVVPAPINNLVVDIVPEGIQLAFVLPSRSLDGSLLNEIGGYWIFRKGPSGEVVREEVCFSISERRRKVGKAVVFLARSPGEKGIYHYRVLPFDAYGSHPSLPGSSVEFYWEGQ